MMRYLALVLLVGCSASAGGASFDASLETELAGMAGAPAEPTAGAPTVAGTGGGGAYAGSHAVVAKGGQASAPTAGAPTVAGTGGTGGGSTSAGAGGMGGAAAGAGGASGAPTSAGTGSGGAPVCTAPGIGVTCVSLPIVWEPFHEGETRRCGTRDSTCYPAGTDPALVPDACWVTQRVCI